MVTFTEVKNNEEIKTYIRMADETLKSLKFTEHSFAHVVLCADVAVRKVSSFIALLCNSEFTAVGRKGLCDRMLCILRRGNLPAALCVSCCLLLRCAPWLLSRPEKSLPQNGNFYAT